MRTTSMGGVALPNVSLCEQQNEVHYTPKPDPYNGHDYVDLGLPSGTKWATMNVGASSESEYGNYYMYGKGAAQYAATSGESNYNGTENPLALSADTAAQVWGGAWHLPTSAQCQELLDFCHVIPVYDGVAGYRYERINDRSKYIFIPSCGYYDNGSLIMPGGVGSIISSTPYDIEKHYALDIDTLGYSTVVSVKRVYGFSVRPVVG